MSSSLFRSIVHEFKYLMISNNPIRFYSKSFKSSFSSTSRIQKKSSSCPWLMLPPAFEGGGGSLMTHNFYSVPENKLITLTGSREKELTDVMSAELYHQGVLTGSSHGYLALFNKYNLDLFLYNPISKRHIKLPPIHNLPLHPKGLPKVILSCSPDEDYDNCRAIMMYTCSQMLAFCFPGRSKEWTPFGRTPCWFDECVYSSGQELLFVLTNDDYLETWDLRGESSPRMIMSSKKYAPTYSEEEEKLLLPWWKRLYLPVDHLVVVDDDDHHLLLVTRYVIEHVAPDGSHVYCFEDGKNKFPHLTVDFNVYKYDPGKGGDDFTYVDSLDGLSLFVGLQSDTVAFPASRFTGVKPDSIYFTDTIGTSYWKTSNPGYSVYDAPFGGHDIGIFNYQDSTVSSCYYPCDLQSVHKILPSPIWFFPSSPI
ncbi:hypothetical protein CASFOL_032778 [Castilleja foliolosa]|uniref:KIB1-4 beta-propeller domain-containing protein n=1 Tax=Castilleja foliolosa TaxID=1961234 RepID=A0ABD3C324_9LAMI